MNTPEIPVACTSSVFATNFNLDQYLQRIGYRQRVYDDIASVSAVMQHPFENLDVLYGTGVSLKPEDIVDRSSGVDAAVIALK